MNFVVIIDKLQEFAVKVQNSPRLGLASQDGPRMGRTRLGPGHARKRPGGAGCEGDVTVSEPRLGNPSLGLSSARV